ncbi:hypothetical protein [Mucilaginibacter gotjawali]|uniref:Uncharacterized protein n=2 Tax=Mucilaginibacter gotjawali TaxID=1550579 RepID=A0A839SJY1_9SPHI|nr:hypothetical protein [Mucilaginibacter gotjawali]MBB3058595.1 hypothetical protein [Mucilaginibacter gotjawali]BAU52438.1 hypothetical protein MgSA37_00599 [Mucilaginibacter gotjawali]
MKKIITTLILSGVFITAFAQKTFKPIHYTMIISGANKNAASGDIKVNMKDSTIIIGEGPAKKFKIEMMAPEQNALSDDKSLTTWLSFLCNGSDSKSYTIMIARQQQPNGTKIMNVQVNCDGADPVVYDCDYLQELYTD